ncbi:MAG: glycosyltransferase family 4 protein [Acidobacteriaceae bacterium]
MRKLRIGVMVTGHFAVPPPKNVIYAPYDVAAAISLGLAQRGHKVSFFAPKGSKLSGVNIIECPIPALFDPNKAGILFEPEVRDLEREKIENLWDQYIISRMYKEALAGKLDALHIHPVDRALPFASINQTIPTVYTLHDPIYPWRMKLFKMFYSPNQHYVAISKSQGNSAKGLPIAATIYNGVDLKAFPYSAKAQDRLLFVGRIKPTKGVAEAVKVAAKTGQKLDILGIFGRYDQDYFMKEVQPFLNEQIRYIGYVPHDELYKYYGKAKAVLMPTKWDEPFGLVSVEAMASGTPVIAFDRGSMPEIIKDGKTGFLVKDVATMCKAVSKIDEIKREDCRKQVEEKFSDDRMVDGYEELFYKLAERKNLKKRIAIPA